MRLELRRVSKRFAGNTALAEVSLDVAAGSRVALIGPNGSGKTTLVRALLGIVGHEGTIELDGRPAQRERDRLAHRIAYVPQIAPQLAASVDELVSTVATLRGLSTEQTWKRASELGLEREVGPRPFRSLSGGMKQKLLLAMAFASEATLFVLDEPTASLDAAARARFFELYHRHARRATLVLCSHRLEEIRHLVDHVVALEEGRVVHDGPVEVYLAGRSVAVLELVGDDLDRWAAPRGFVPGTAGRWRRQVTGPEKLQLLDAAMRDLGHRLRDVSVRDVDRLEVDRAA
jgi:ABC-type multidrug transport system ATPase subunit